MKELYGKCAVHVPKYIILIRRTATASISVVLLHYHMPKHHVLAILAKLAQASVHVLVSPQLSRDRINSESKRSTGSSGSSSITHEVYSCECSSCQQTIGMCMLLATALSTKHSAAEVT
jgi:hypothetical protein